MVSFPGSTPAGHAGENAYKGARLENTEPPSEPEVPETIAQELAENKAARRARKKEDKPEHAAEDDNEQISVFLARLVYCSPVSHNSLSVKVLQARLVELGFVQAGVDQAGLFADGTQAAVAAYQTEHKLDATGEVNEQTLKAIFRNDKRVKLILPD